MLFPVSDAVNVRAARDEDGPGLISLIRAVFDEYPGCVLDVENEAPELLEIATHFKRGGGEFWIAEDAQRSVVGSVGWLPAQAVSGIELRKLYVADAQRKRGLGSELCSLIEREATRRGAEFVDLWSDTRFETAHHFYERRGFSRGSETRELGDLSASVEYYYRLRLAV
ncbi:MAG: GNAT family N-acetyltransferase [bacterium]|nr:GNAT family N-acetyltransferase [bacterium]